MKGQPILPLKIYLLVWVVLLALLLVTVGSAYIPLGPFNVALNFLISLGKALLVLAFFMHLKYASSLTRIFAAAGFFWLLLLFGLTMSDYGTRPQPVSSEEIAYIYQEKPSNQLLQPRKSTPPSQVATPSGKALKTEQIEINLSRGKQIYKRTCSPCHGVGTLGAPRIGDKRAWKSRVQKGLDTLVSHAVNGFKAMPPKGGNPKLTQSEVRDGIIYILTESDVDLGQTK